MLALNFSPFPELHTERLVLRRMHSGDAEALYYMRSSKKIMQYVERPSPESIAEMEERIASISAHIDENTSIAWGISYHNDPQLIGTVSYHRIIKEHFRAEIGYMLHNVHWRKGIMNEAVTAVIAYGFEQMKLHSLEALVNPDNEASIQLLLKQGFVKEGHIRENYYYNGKFGDTGIYSLIRYPQKNN